MATLKEAITAIKLGDKKTGQRLLKEFIQENPKNETAWLWLAVAVNDPQRKKQCLQRVLEINPDNATARQGLSLLEVDATEEAPRLDDIIPNPALPQTEFITRAELAESSKNILKGLSIIVTAFPLCFGLAVLVVNPEYIGRMIFSCRSRGVSDELCSQPTGWIMMIVIFICSIIVYFTTRKLYALQQGKEWGLRIVLLIIFVLFFIISVFLTAFGPAVLIVMETPFGGVQLIN